MTLLLSAVHEGAPRPPVPVLVSLYLVLLFSADSIPGLDHDSVCELRAETLPAGGTVDEQVEIYAARNPIRTPLSQFGLRPVRCH